MTRHLSGFSLLEAIVALALIATTGMALLAWVNTNLVSVERVATKQQALAAKRLAAAYLESINPMETPSGEARLGEFRLAWNSTLAEPKRDGRAIIGGGISLFQLGLYDVDVRVSRAADSELVTQFVVRLAGYEQVRSPLEGIE